MLQGATWIMYIIWANNLNGIMMSLSNLFFYSGLALEVYCMITTENNNKKRVAISYATLSILSVIFYTLFRENIEIRVFITSLFVSALFLHLFTKFIFKFRPLTIKPVIGGIALVAAFAHMCRGIFSIYQHIELPIFSDNFIQTFTGFIWIIVSFTFPIMFLYLLKSQDNVRLNELNITKNNFFRIIGHDLKSPIAQMIQLSYLIEEKYKELSDEDLLKYIRAMKDSSLRGLKFLESLLNWATAQTGAISYNPSDESLHNLVNDNIELLKKNADIKNIKIINQVDKDSIVNVDKNMINTVIRNLLSNAIKFTYTDGVIEVGNTNKYDKIEIYVKDNGKGIPKEKCKNLFKIDSEYSTLGTNNEIGTGIGLLLCKEFINHHKGEIWVESEINKGAKFYFSVAKAKCLHNLISYQ